MSSIAIVIGATGLVGRALVDQLVASEHIGMIITLTRRTAEHFSPKVHNQVVRFDHLEEHAALFAGDLMFSCLGTTRKQAGSIAAQRTVDLEYQYKAAQLAAQQGVRHYLLVSSSGANANSGNAYLRMKGELEQRVRSLPFGRITIFQPSLLLGQRTEPRLGEQLWSRILPVFCAIPGLRRFRPIKGEQVAAKMVRVSKNPGQPLEWFRLDEIFLTDEPAGNGP
jgi:uncharacterized protein YbjT (DUF2867 family)